MSNSHSATDVDAANRLWHAVNPPRRGEDSTVFYVQLLLPGMSIAFHAAALGRSRASVSTYHAAAARAAQSDPAVIAAVNAGVRALKPEDGLAMARVRGPAQLPHWSRMAIRDYSKRGFTRQQIATAFRCSPGTVANVLQGKGTSYSLFSGERRLTHTQRNPPGRWKEKRQGGLTTVS